ncbi:MAG: DEAD/DEAH box helicase [Spirochaetales bacterium]|nr:DEAD/DEAH box helicase [Spirochaetales bacterium]
MEQQYLFDDFEAGFQEPRPEKVKKTKKSPSKVSAKKTESKPKEELPLSLFDDLPLFAAADLNQSDLFSGTPQGKDERSVPARTEIPEIAETAAGAAELSDPADGSNKSATSQSHSESVSGETSSGSVAEIPGISRETDREAETPPEETAEPESESAPEEKTVEEPVEEKPPWSHGFVIEPDFFTDTMTRGLSVTAYHVNNYPAEEENPLHPWGTSDETGELTSCEQKLYRLLKKNRELYRLSDSFGQIDAGEIDSFFYRDYRGLIEVDVRKIVETRISFVFYDHKGGDPYYMPQVTFSDGKTSSRTLYLPHEFYNDSGLFYLLDIHSAVIFFMRETGEASDWIIDFFANSTSMSEEEIIRLSERVGKGLPEGIFVELPQSRIEYLNPEPLPVLEFSERGRKSRISLFFRYEDREFAFRTNTSASFISEKTDDVTTIINRNTDFEMEAFSYFCEVMEDKLIYSDLEFRDGFTFEFKSSVDKMLLNYGEQLIADGAELRRRGAKQKIRMAAGFSFSVNKSSDWLDIKTRIKDTDGNFDDPVFDSFTPGDPLMKGRNGFYLIRQADLEKLEQLRNMGMDGDGELSISSFNLGMIDVLYEEIENRDNEEVRRLGKAIEGLQHFDEIGEAEPPQGLNATLRHYQQAGLNWLYFLNQYNLNGCLADDMGLGKTIQTLALLMKLKNEGRLEKALIVVPVSTMPNWQDEAEKFTPSLKTIRHYGPGRATTELELQGIDIILVSFHTLRNDIELFSSMDFTYIILDEAQNIKNASSQIFKSVKLVNARHRLSLTGTPIENNTMDLWSQFDFLNPGLLGSAEQFRRRFARPIEDENDEGATELLRKIVFPFILRRKKEDVVKDLPEKEEIIQHIELGYEQRRLYNEIREYYRNKVSDSVNDNGVAGSQMVIFEALLRLRQAANFPKMVSEEYSHIIPAKFEMLKDLIREIMEENHKILIFSQFVKSLHIIRDFLNQAGISYSYLDGQTRDRDGQIKSFQNDEENRVFLISLKAGGVGINLTSADYVVLFDPWWNPAIEAQAIARSHRIGQQNRVIAYKFIAKDTVEDKILEMQNRKKMLVEDVVSTESSFFKSLGKEDVVNLFS